MLVSVGGIAGTLSRFGLGEIFPNDRAGTLAANLIGVGPVSYTHLTLPTNREV